MIYVVEFDIIYINTTYIDIFKKFTKEDKNHKKYLNKMKIFNLQILLHLRSLFRLHVITYAISIY